jgi:isoquinoline 1-oxidoreductase alpha subunit
MHVDGVAIRSCVMPSSAMAGEAEDLAATPQARLQQTWGDETVSHCRTCQSGMLTAAAVLLKAKHEPCDEDIDEAMSTICHCGTYPRARRAVRRADGAMDERHGR